MCPRHHPRGCAQVAKVEPRVVCGPHLVGLGFEFRVALDVHTVILLSEPVAHVGRKCIGMQRRQRWLGSEVGNGIVVRGKDSAATPGGRSKRVGARGLGAHLGGKDNRFKEDESGK